MKVNEFIVEDDDSSTKEYFGFSCWGNPYRANDSEYFVTGPFESSAEARKSVQRRLANGQPRNFTNWVSGTVKVVDSVEKLVALLNRTKLTVPKSIQSGDYSVGEAMLWRLSAQ